MINNIKKSIKELIMGKKSLNFDLLIKKEISRLPNEKYYNLFLDNYNNRINDLNEDEKEIFQRNLLKKLKLGIISKLINFKEKILFIELGQENDNECICSIPTFNELKKYYMNKIFSFYNTIQDSFNIEYDNEYDNVMKTIIINLANKDSFSLLEVNKLLSNLENKCLNIQNNFNDNIKIYNENIEIFDNIILLTSNLSKYNNYISKCIYTLMSNLQEKKYKNLSNFNDLYNYNNHLNDILTKIYEKIKTIRNNDLKIVCFCQENNLMNIFDERKESYDDIIEYQSKVISNLDLYNKLINLKFQDIDDEKKIRYISEKVNGSDFPIFKRYLSDILYSRNKIVKIIEANELSFTNIFDNFNVKDVNKIDIDKIDINRFMSLYNQFVDNDGKSLFKVDYNPTNRIKLYKSNKSLDTFITFYKHLFVSYGEFKQSELISYNYKSDERLYDSQYNEVIFLMKHSRDDEISRRSSRRISAFDYTNEIQRDINDSIKSSYEEQIFSIYVICEDRHSILVSNEYFNNKFYPDNVELFLYKDGKSNLNFGKKFGQSLCSIVQLNSDSKIEINRTVAISKKYVLIKFEHENSIYHCICDLNGNVIYYYKDIYYINLFDNYLILKTEDDFILFDGLKGTIKKLNYKNYYLSFHGDNVFAVKYGKNYIFSYDKNYKKPIRTISTNKPLLEIKGLLDGYNFEASESNEKEINSSEKKLIKKL